MEIVYINVLIIQKLFMILMELNVFLLQKLFHALGKKELYFLIIFVFQKNNVILIFIIWIIIILDYVNILKVKKIVDL